MPRKAAPAAAKTMPLKKGLLDIMNQISAVQDNIAQLKDENRQVKAENARLKKELAEASQTNSELQAQFGDDDKLAQDLFDAAEKAASSAINQQLIAGIVAYPTHGDYNLARLGLYLIELAKHMPLREFITQLVALAAPLAQGADHNVMQEVLHDAQSPKPNWASHVERLSNTSPSAMIHVPTLDEEIRTSPTFGTDGLFF